MISSKPTQLLNTSRYPRPFAEAVNRAFSALFEGLNPSQKTRRALRGILPVPPGGWDAPAQTEDGQDYVSANGNVLSWIVALETYIRTEFFNRSGLLEKFEPGVARIAYTDLGMWPEGVEDYRDTQAVPHTELLTQFKSIVRMLGGAHADEYDIDLNGMTLDDMLRRFGTYKAPVDMDDEDDLSKDTGSTDYRVVRIDSFQDAQKFYHCWDDNERSRWCITQDIKFFNRYTKRGLYTQYFLLAPGFEDAVPEKGPDFPKDEYGRSMIGVTVGPQGTVEFCCTRWNHADGATEHAYTKGELTELLGRPFSLLCPYAGKRSTMSVKSIIDRLDAGESPDTVYDTSRFGREELIFDRRFVRYNTVNEEDEEQFILVDKETMRPAWDVEMSSFRALDDSCIFAECVSDETDEYGDDISMQYLLRADGNSRLLAASSYGGDLPDEPMFTDVIYNIGATCFPGVYMVELSNSEYGNNVMVTRDFQQLTGLHEHIHLYNGGIIACDLDRDEWTNPNAGYLDGCPEVIRIEGKDYRTAKELLGQELYRKCGDEPTNLITITDDSGRNACILVHISDALYAITGRMAKTIDHGVSEIEAVNTADLYGIIAVHKGDYIYMLDLNGGEIREGEGGISDFDQDGIVTYLDDDSKNIVGPDGKPVFESNFDEIFGVYAGYGLPIAGSFAILMKDGKAWYWRPAKGNRAESAGQMIYDRPLDVPGYDRSAEHPYSEDAILPYTKSLYIGPAGDGKKAIFSLDGEMRSEPFDRLSPVQHPFKGTVVEKAVGENGENLRGIVDIRTGRLLTPWLNKIVRLNGYIPGRHLNEISEREGCEKDNSPYADLYALVTPEGKGTVAALCGSAWQLAKFGWADKIASFPETPILKLEIGGKEVIYDMYLDKVSPWDFDRTLRILDIFGEKYSSVRDYGSLPTSKKWETIGNAMYLVENHDWIEWGQKLLNSDRELGIRREGL